MGLNSGGGVGKPGGGGFQSSALESFMKFDRKYAAKKRAEDGNNSDETTDVSEARAQSPSRIASELEEKLVPSRRSSSARRESAAAPADVSPRQALGRLR